MFSKKLIGDFNFPNIDWSTWTAMSSDERKFIDCLRKFNNLLSQQCHVVCPTRARATHNPHILDLVITNEDFVSEINNLSPLGKSYHSVLEINCKLSCIPILTGSRLNLNKGDCDDLRRFMDVDWEKYLDIHAANINLTWLAFKDLLLDGVKKNLSQRIKA